MSGAAPIEDYALIGDCGTAALVSRHGAIDWLCLPRFDSDPVFARLLDPDGGHFALCPDGAFTATRRYLDDTAVLCTTFETADGRVTVHDFFAAAGRDEKRRGLWPFRYLVRRVEGLSGRVRLTAEVAPRDAFGGLRRRRFRLHARGRRLWAQSGGAALLLESSSPFTVCDDTGRSVLEVSAGDVAHVVMSYAGRDLGVLPPAGRYAEESFARTVAWWRAWASREQVGGAHREMVRRSAITLKLLTFAPSGAVVAAPTTSLPEVPGGGRNWDYRFSWVRDASWTIEALTEMGYMAHAHAYLYWAANAARLTQPRVHTMYTLHGSHHAPEREVPGLRGYGGARPVRVGNGAVDQLQLDNWGHLVDAAWSYVQHGGHIDAVAWTALRAFVDHVARIWRQPDQGMWEVRGDPHHFVHSKVLCWVALDRGVRLVRECGLRGPADAWARERDRVRDAVLRDGVDPQRGTLKRAFDDDSVDASLLLVPMTGFLPAGDPRMVRTIDAVRADLGAGELVYRYRGDDGLSGREGAFVACSFWLAHALALAGRRDEACEIFERTCARANDVGLLPEEIDPETGAFLGNFPQGLSHIALLNAAIALAE